MLAEVPRWVPLLGMLVGYAIFLFANPNRIACRDGLRCLGRFPRIWVTFVLLGLAYAIFRGATLNAFPSFRDLSLREFASWQNWTWPDFSETILKSALPATEGVAGIFDVALTTYPLSVIAALLLIINWRGLHGSLMRALRKRFNLWGYLIYVIVLAGAVASLCKPILYWRLPEWGKFVPAGTLLQASAAIDTLASIFEYLFGVYVQVYLILVCLAWIKGLHFDEDPLARFAVRRFSYVFEWAGIVALVSTWLIHVPLLVAYFTDIPGILDYLPHARWVMNVLLIGFAAMQISLILHNESLGKALQAHREFLQKNAGRFGWFLLLAGVHFGLLLVLDTAIRDAAADRVLPSIAWKVIYVCLRGLITGWLLATWVCLYRQCEPRRVSQEGWIRY